MELRRRPYPKFPLSTYLFVFTAALFGTVARSAAACLTGPGATGIEVGGHTLQVSPFTGSLPVAVSTGPGCLPNALVADPGVLPGGTGRAEMTANNLGYSQRASVILNAGVTGSAYAEVLGSVSFAFRIKSETGYTGPEHVDVDIDVLLDISGSVSASGTGSAGSAAYTASGGLKLAGDLLGTELFSFQGGSVGAVPRLLEISRNLAIDSDYIIKFAATQQVSATASSSLSTGSAAASGTTRISYGVGLSEGLLQSASFLESTQVPGLSIVFTMTEALNLATPAAGFPPLLPSELTPIPLPMPALLLGTALCVLWRKRRPRSRPTVPVREPWRRRSVRPGMQPLRR